MERMLLRYCACAPALLCFSSTLVMYFIFPPWSRHTNVSGLRPFLCPVKRAPWHMANASCCERFMVVVRRSSVCDGTRGV